MDLNHVHGIDSTYFIMSVLFHMVIKAKMGFLETKHISDIKWKIRQKHFRSVTNIVL